MKNGDQPPSGVMMMLKALGIQFDPAMFKTMAEAVEEIRARLQRIEEKVNKIPPVHHADAVPQLEEKNNVADRNGKEVVGRTQG